MDFYRKHARRIEHLSDLLLTHAEQFMAEQGTPTLPPAVHAELMQPLDAGDLPTFAQALREAAVHFVMAGNSAEFWSLLNALQSLCQALEKARHSQADESGERALDHLQEQLASQTT